MNPEIFGAFVGGGLTGLAIGAFIAAPPLARVLRQRVARLEDALRFYRDEWVTASAGDSSIAGGSYVQRWQEPSDALCEDAGERARIAVGDADPWDRLHDAEG